MAEPRGKQHARKPGHQPRPGSLEQLQGPVWRPWCQWQLDLRRSRLVWCKSVLFKECESKTEILKQCDRLISANAQLPCKCWLQWGHWSQLEPSVSGMGRPQPLLAGKRLPTTKTLPPTPRANRNHYLPAISFPHSKYNLIFMQLNGIVQHLQLPQS